ncbi:MAG: bifunctional 3,4-dihydroxy-2-butanone 4-phosphate synthase/GTP cyclohydrolase II [Campylobacteraceae bacterium]|jgi:3,4-dihydroxy 2-butanone 4-phosphate synthase/GTP cyclohydrolase II|nr:bifunctional 3,4-dihydroxy-2-butanone 4-phosphate synthase/GTP cyclohydrolase II [Campylobacteraceae bacterium]
MLYKRVRDAVEDIRNGKMVVMVDDEDRENEGDLVYASAFSTPEKVNFMITHAKGLVCMCVTNVMAKRLNLTPMVENNDSAHETAFTISVDARAAKTGISAIERDMTIKIIVNPNSIPKDLVRPGHIFPLIAKEGGVLVRTGHTEGSIDLCRLAGVGDSAVICEVVKDDGDMARRDDLDLFCKKHDIKMVSIAELVKYRMKHESLIREQGREKTEFLGVKTEKIDFLDHLNNHHAAFIFGKISQNFAVKFHNVTKDIELLSSSKKFNSLISSIEYLKKNGGVLIFLDVETKFTDNMKEYGIGAQILNYLGVRKVTLLSSNGSQEFVGIKGFDLDIEKEVIV